MIYLGCKGGIASSPALPMLFFAAKLDDSDQQIDDCREEFDDFKTTVIPLAAFFLPHVLPSFLYILYTYRCVLSILFSYFPK